MPRKDEEWRLVQAKQKIYEDERDSGAKELKKHVKVSWSRWIKVPLGTCKREYGWMHQHIHKTLMQIIPFFLTERKSV